MALLAEPPYAQRLLNRSEVQKMLQSLEHRSHRYVGQQLLHPEAQRISLREDLPHKHATGASFGGTRLIINPVESQREPSKPILLGHLAAETGSAFELMYVKYLLEEGRVTMAREILQRILQQYPADEKLLHFYNAIAPGKVVRTNMVTVQVVKTGITPQLATSDRSREAETEPLPPAGRLHMRR